MAVDLEDDDTKKRISDYHNIEPNLGARTTVDGLLAELGGVLSAQDEVWGEEHDSSHKPYDWIYLVRKHLTHVSEDEFHSRWLDYQRELFTVAALCIQAVRTHRRETRRPQEATRQ